MGTYTQATFSSGAAITAAGINGEFAKVATAINTLDSTNFDGSTAVPNGDLANPNAYFTLQMGTSWAAAAVDTTVPVSQTDLLIDQIPIPCACTLVGIDVTSHDITATASVDVWYSGATVLSGGPITLAADDTNYSHSSFTKTSYAANDLISLRATTDGTGLIYLVRMVLLFKAAHVA